MATAKGFGAKGAAAGAERGASKSILNEELQSTLDLLKSTLAKDAEKIAAGQKPFFKSPEEAAAYWDKAYKQISTGVTKGIYPIGPNAPRITYKKDGQLFTLDRDVKPPAGAERVSLTDADILKMMPPRPQVPPKPAGEPNAYGNPPPPEYTARMQPSPAAQEAIQTAKETLNAKAQPVPETPTLPREFRKSPSDAGPASTYTPPGSSQAVNTARDTLAAPRATSGAEPSNLAVYGAPAAIGAGSIALGAQALQDAASTSEEPGTFRRILNTYTGGPDPYMSPREESPNLDNMPSYMGPGVSYDQSDLAPGNYPWNPNMPGIERPSDLELPVSAVPAERFLTMPGQEQRFRPASYEGQAQRFNPGSPAVSTARQVIQRAQNSPTAQAQQAAAVLQESPNQLTVQKGPEQGPNALTRFIRGDFTEGADQRIMEAMRRQREESGVDSGRASGGAAPKKSNKDDVLHKALEIIHHMLTRR